MDYILFETAPGYALFKVNEAEDIGAMVESMQESIQEYQTFAKVVSLAAFLPFRTAEQMLDNMNALSEGVLTDDLKGFITTYVPRDKVLGVVEDKLASAIAEACEVQCVKTKQVVEVQRGIRLHFTKFIEGMKTDDLDKAQRSLGHSYSGSKVKFNVNKSDNMIIQSICLLDQLDKDVNTLAMRAREWYSWHFPELVTVVPDNYTYARCVMTIGKKESIMEDQEGSAERLREVLGEDSEDVVAQIIEASKTSMGYEISDFDLECVMHFAERVVKLTEYKRDLQAYLVKKMHTIAPNLSSLIGLLLCLVFCDCFFVVVALAVCSGRCLLRGNSLFALLFVVFPQPKRHLLLEHQSPPSFAPSFFFLSHALLVSLFFFTLFCMCLTEQQVRPLVHV